MIAALFRLRVVGTVESAAGPALLAATHPEAHGDEFYGPAHTLGGRATRQDFWPPLHDVDLGRRVWDASLRLVGALEPTS